MAINSNVCTNLYLSVAILIIKLCLLSIHLAFGLHDIAGRPTGA